MNRGIIETEERGYPSIDEFLAGIRFSTSSTAATSDEKQLELDEHYASRSPVRINSKMIDVGDSFVRIQIASLVTSL
jgi:hypothetical protein